MKDQNIFNRRELRLLYANKPELKPIKVPSLDDVDKVRVPSINEADILNQPTLDQIILQFLHQYEVNVQPRSVGAWNGWDILSAASTLSTAIFSEKEDYNLNIASTIMMANRSNQINSAAQEWGTWKRWALDHKNFEQFKDDVIQNITLHNEKVLKEIDEQIKKAELNNQKIFAILEETDAKQFIAEQKELANQKIALISFYSSILLIISFFLMVLFAVIYGFGVLKKENFDVLNNFFSNVIATSIITAFFTGILAIFIKSKKRNLGIIGTIISTACMIILLLS